MIPSLKNRVVFYAVVLALLFGNGGALYALTYQYDSLNRLTNVDYGNGSVISYTYDPAGNRLTYSAVVGSTNIIVSNNLDSGPGSLRQAIQAANNLGSGTITFSGVTGTITLTSGELVVAKNINIVGPGSTVLAVSGNAVSRIFNVSSNVKASISGLTIQNGSVQGWGGGVYNIGNLALNDCVVASNSSSFSGTYGSILGGGIYSSGTLALTNCIVTNNWVNYFNNGFGGMSGLGGGIFNQGILTLYHSVVTSNWCAQVVAVGRVTGGSGGGIYNSNSATIILSTIANNRSGNGNDNLADSSPGPGGGGGGIYNSGTLLVDRSAISGNASGNGGSGVRYGFNGGAGGSGAGVWNSGQLTMTSSTVSGNSSGSGGDGAPYASSSLKGGQGGGGGGVYNAGMAWLTNCTVFGNTGGNGGNGQLNPYSGQGTHCDGGNGGNGGGILNQANIFFSSCTVYINISGNAGTGSPPGTNIYGVLPPGTNGIGGVGGGIWQGGSAGQVINTLIASNSAVGGSSDVAGNVISLGFNLIGNTNGSTGFGAAGDLIGVNPLLGPLADNGGPTRTCALLTGSPAIDAGTTLGAPNTDQRGVTRPQGSNVDIGAFELISSTPFLTVVPASLDFGSIPTGTTEDRIFYVTNTGGATLAGNATVATPFSIVTGGNYNLGANQGQEVTVRYSPVLAGSNSQTAFFTGGVGAERAVTGSAVVATRIPQLSGMVVKNGMFQFVLNGPVGSKYVVQVSSNLLNWVDLATNVIPTGGLRVFDFPIQTNQPMMFYRAMPWAPASQIYILAASGEITAPFILTDGYIYQSIQTTTVTDGGRATYNFNIDQAGTYVIQTTVNAPGDSANSFFLNIDAEPQSPTMIWDIFPFTTGFEQRTVSWRGNGSDTNNQFIPNVFNLTAGSHQLIIRGREANAQLQDVTIVPYP